MRGKRETAEPTTIVAIHLPLTKAQMDTVRATGQLTGRWLRARLVEAIEAEARRQAARAGDMAGIAIGGGLIPLLPMRPYAGDVLGGAEVPAEYSELSPLLREAAASCALDGETMSLEECRICGCTRERACVTRQGPCAWSEPGLCTGCVDRRGGRRPRVKKGDLAIVAPGVTDKRSHWLAACGAPGCPEELRLADFTDYDARVNARDVGWTISRKAGRGWVCPVHSVRSRR